MIVHSLPSSLTVAPVSVHAPIAPGSTAASHSLTSAILDANGDQVTEESDDDFPDIIDEQ